MRLGPRSVGWPASEVAAINTARIAGMTDDQIRALVIKLEAARKTAAVRFEGMAMQNTSTAQVTPLAPPKNSANVPVALCRYAGGRFELSETGVYFLGKDKDGNEQSPQWVCTPLHVIAKTRDEKSGEWGRLLKWQDDEQSHPSMADAA